MASFLLLGPTGVGKTEMVKVLTKEIYGDTDKFMLKIDMSEFRERHNLSRLLGAPAGYVGYEDAPQLTDWLKRKPYSVILFDEIEKGHPEVLNILLQMLEDGKITDAKGTSVSCEHCMVFMTSNLGKSQLNKFASKIGFVDMQNKEEEDYQVIKKQVMDEVEKSIKPEILGRITGKIVFRPISKSILSKIIYKELSMVQKHLLKSGKSISFKDEVVEFLVEKLSEKLDYGARQIKGIIAINLFDPISEWILDNPSCLFLDVTVKSKAIFVKGK
jgi:ATP-dependent Clp protease ATP-binding subunit ClpC